MNEQGQSRRDFLKRGGATLAAAASGSILGRGPLGLTTAAHAAADSIVSPIAFAHMAVRAGDLGASRQWYKTVLGCREPFAVGFGAWQTYDEEHHRVALFMRGGSGAPPEGMGGCDHFSFTYDSLGDLVQNYRRLKALGITPRRVVKYGPTTSMYYFDPSANAVELLVDGFESADDLERYCSSGVLVSDRNGEEIDPDTLVGSVEATAGVEGKIITPSAITHTVIKTARYEDMIGWYTLALGCRVQYQNDRVTFLTYDERHHRIAIVHDPGAKLPNMAHGFDHFAYEFQTMEDLAVKTYARLKAEGIVPYWTTNHGVTTSMYYPDPDGNRVEMQVDNYKTKAEGLKYMSSAEFAANPIGVDFDPDEMVEKVKGGASYEELHHRVEGRRQGGVPGSQPSPWRAG